MLVLKDDMEEPLEERKRDAVQELDDGGSFLDNEPEDPNPEDDFILRCLN